MGRKVTEWIGKTDDTPIPSRVKLRMFIRYGRVCAVCTLVIRGTLRPAFDHVKALINGGENREGNLQLLCDLCHRLKTASDVGEKSYINRVVAQSMGIKKRKGRPMPGSKASGIRRRMDGRVERR